MLPNFPGISASTIAFGLPIAAAGTRRALARVGIGIATREGAPKPDITKPDALRKTLLAHL